MAVRRFAGWLGAALLATAALASSAQAGSADRLHAKHEQLRGQLASNQFHKPLYLESSESPVGVTGDAYALVDHPFATVAAALGSPGDWCEILILPINTKYCRASLGSQGSILNVSIGSKHEQSLDEAYRLEFVYRVVARTPGYLQVTLNADRGPFSTRDYRIVLEAVPVEDGRTFIHLSYSYAFDMAGRLAMQVYLGTAGRGKVGFTVTATQSDGQPSHIGGTRGAVERNTMRYLLAIEAFLDSLRAPPEARFEHRLRDWFTAAERYPRQLHEMERGEYLVQKRREHLRQQAVLPALSMHFQEAVHVQVAGAGR